MFAFNDRLALRTIRLYAPALSHKTYEPDAAKLAAGISKEHVRRQAGIVANYYAILSERESELKR